MRAVEAARIYPQQSVTRHNDNLILPEIRATRADAIKNRELLLETASRLFQQHGVEAVSMTQVAEAAGVGKGTLYRHFNNKTELCFALLDDQQRELQSSTLERLRYQAPPLETLRWFLVEVAGFVDRHDELLFVGTDGHVSALSFDAHLWWRQTIRGLLQKLDVSGDLDYRADVLYVLLDVNTIHFQRQTLGYSLDKITSGLLTTLESLLC